MSKNLLLEIGTEEMPANMMSGIVEQMHALAGAKLDEARIALKSGRLRHTEKAGCHRDCRRRSAA